MVLELATTAELEIHLAGKESLEDVAIQGLDLRPYTSALLQRSLRRTIFLGCQLETAALEHALHQGALIFPPLPDLPYHPYRGTLYTPEELLGSYQPGQSGSYQQTLDGQVYAHYLATGGSQPPSILESLSRRLHDHAMTDAVEELIEGRRVVAIMGGHSLARTDPQYRNAARISRLLTRNGALMTSGGGPGAMEATHLGAWFAERSEAELDEAINRLGRAPRYFPIEAWFDTAFEVWRQYPADDSQHSACTSLGIPTWLFGHEPPTVFATHIAKYFANSVREDGLVTIARGGIVYAPGSAGTIQEIFQDATQNHYGTLDVISPMIFLGIGYWTEQKPVYPLLQQLAQDRDYHHLLGITEDPKQAVAWLESYHQSGSLDG